MIAEHPPTAATRTPNPEHPRRRPRAGHALYSLVFLTILALLSACSVTVGPPPGTPGPGQPTNTPIEQVHFDVTPVPSPTPEPPTATPAPLPPGVTPGPGGTVTYTIKAGDTLSGIADQFGITVEDIVKTNNIADPNAIQAGEVLVIPVGAATPAAAATATAVPSPAETPTTAP